MAKNTETHTQFKRKARIGFNPISCDETNPTLFVDVVSPTIEKFEMRNGETIDYVDAVNMSTGEEQRVWLSGQLRYNLQTIMAKRTLKGLKLEINYKGQKAVEINGEKTKVNQYELFELAD